METILDKLIKFSGHSGVCIF